MSFCLYDTFEVDNFLFIMPSLEYNILSDLLNNALPDRSESLFLQLLLVDACTLFLITSCKVSCFWLPPGAGPVMVDRSPDAAVKRTTGVCALGLLSTAQRSYNDVFQILLRIILLPYTFLVNFKLCHCIILLIYYAFICI